VAGLLGAQPFGLPIGLLAQEALRVVGEQADEDLGDDPPADGSEARAVARPALGLDEDVVPERRLGLQGGFE
jgi:hypothetical protein